MKSRHPDPATLEEAVHELAVQELGFDDRKLVQPVVTEYLPSYLTVGCGLFQTHVDHSEDLQS